MVRQAHSLLLRLVSGLLMALRLWVLVAFVVAGCASNPGSVAVAPPAPDPVVIETVSETSSGSEEFVPDPIGGSEHSDAELDGSLASLAARAPSPPPIPVNGVVIVNRDGLDGSALSVNQTLNLRAIAGDAQGVDVSSRIQWLNASGTVIGTGGTLAYSSAQAKMETLTARRRDATSQRQRISFTVSPATVLVARFVKVLSDAVAADVRELNLAQNRVVLTQSDRLPVIRIGDVVIGAAGRVPPLRVSQIQYLNGTQRLTVSEALPRQVIRRGSASFTQAVNWSGSTPPDGVELINIPADPFHIAEVLTPKWAGFVRAGSNVSKRLSVKANASVSWQPTYTGTIAFDSAFGEGIKEFTLNQTSPFSTSVSLQASGLYTWNDTAKGYPLIANPSTLIRVPLGPIPIPIRLVVGNQLELLPDATLRRQATLNLSYTNGSLTQLLRFYQPVGWQYRGQIGGPLAGNIGSGTDFIGNLSYAFHVYLWVKLLNQDGPLSGVRFYQTGSGVDAGSKLTKPASDLRTIATVQGRALIDTFGQATTTLFPVDLASVSGLAFLERTVSHRATPTPAPTPIPIIPNESFDSLRQRCIETIQIIEAGQPNREQAVFLNYCSSQRPTPTPTPDPCLEGVLANVRNNSASFYCDRTSPPPDFQPAQSVPLLLKYGREAGLSRPQMAYVLATAGHETGMGCEMTEEAGNAELDARESNDPRNPLKKWLCLTQAGDGRRFLGRGLVQITGRCIYTYWTQQFGDRSFVGNGDLIADPTLPATNLDMSAYLAVYGMQDGAFSSLGQINGDFIPQRPMRKYIPNTTSEVSISVFTTARELVNGNDNAVKIAGYAMNYQTALKNCNF